MGVETERAAERLEVAASTKKVRELEEELASSEEERNRLHADNDALQRSLAWAPAEAESLRDALERSEKAALEAAAASSGEIEALRRSVSAAMEEGKAFAPAAVEAAVSRCEVEKVAAVQAARYEVKAEMETDWIRKQVHEAEKAAACEKAASQAMDVGMRRAEERHLVLIEEHNRANQARLELAVAEAHGEGERTAAQLRTQLVHLTSERDNASMAQGRRSSALPRR